MTYFHKYYYKGIDDVGIFISR